MPDTDSSRSCGREGTDPFASVPWTMVGACYSLASREPRPFFFCPSCFCIPMKVCNFMDTCTDVASSPLSIDDTMRCLTALIHRLLCSHSARCHRPVSFYE